MPKLTVQTSNAPAPLGHLAQAVRMGPLLFISGQLPTRPEDGHIEEGGMRKQAYKVLHNLYQVLAAAGAQPVQVVKLTVYLTDPTSEKYADEEIKRFYPEEPPARTTVFVHALPKMAKIQIDAIAVLA